MLILAATSGADIHAAQAAAHAAQAAAHAAQAAANAALQAAQQVRAVSVVQAAKPLWDTTAGGAIIGGALTLLGVLVTGGIQWWRDRIKQMDEQRGQRAIIRALLRQILVSLKSLAPDSSTKKSFLEFWMADSYEADMFRDHWEIQTRMLSEQVFKTTTPSTFHRTGDLYLKVVRTSDALLATYMVMRHQPGSHPILDVRIVNDLIESVNEVLTGIDDYDLSVRSWWHQRQKQLAATEQKPSEPLSVGPPEP